MRKRGYPLVGSSNLPLRNSFLFFIHLRFFKKFNKVVLFFQVTSSYGHTTVKAPHPIRTAKLSTVGLVQYFGRGLQGNHQCCMAFFYFYFSFFKKNNNKKRIRRGRFELPTKGSLRLRTLQSSALPLSYLRTTCLPPAAYLWMLDDQKVLPPDTKRPRPPSPLV